MSIVACLTKTIFRTQDMTSNRIAKPFLQGLQVTRHVCQDPQQPRLGRLTGESLVESRFAPTIPDGQAKCRIVAQQVDVILR